MIFFHDLGSVVLGARWGVRLSLGAQRGMSSRVEKNRLSGKDLVQSSESCDEIRPTGAPSSREAPDISSISFTLQFLNRRSLPALSRGEAPSVAALDNTLLPLSGQASHSNT